MEEDLVMTDQWREAIEDNRELVEVRMIYHTRLLLATLAIVVCN
jgi:hypothetical protein